MNTSPFVYPILLVFFLLQPAVSSAQEVIEENSSLSPKIGAFSIVNRSIRLAKTNSALFKGDYQNFKKAVAYLTFRDPNDSDKIKIGTGFLVNTVENTNVDQDGSPLLYFLTVAHNNVPVSGRPDNSLSPEHPKTKEIYLSFDFEIANPTLNSELPYFRMSITDDEKQKIKDEYVKVRRLWRIKLELALYKIKPFENYPWSIDDSEVFQHVYALGWNTRLKDIKTPESEDAELKLIGHPLGDTKMVSTRLFSNYKIVQHFSDNGRDLEIDNIDEEKQYRIVKRLMPSFPRYSFYLPPGSSGSPILNFENKVLSVHQGKISRYRKSYSGLIQNCWHYRNYIGERENDLQTYVDQNNTYISKIPGGYVMDLVKNNHEEINYDLTVDSDGIQIPVSLDHIDFFGFNKYDIYENRLGYGIHLDPNQIPLAPGNSIHLKLTDKFGSEIFKAIYSTENTNINGRTHFKFYNGIQPVVDLDNDFFGEALIVFNNELLENIRAQAVTEIKKLSEAKLDNATLSIYTTGATQQVRAVKLPLLPAYSARELFEENPYEDLWRSYKYRDNHFNSTNLYIDKVTIGNSSGDEDNINVISSRTIETSDNGGYLNLVNSNYSIDPFELSVELLDSNGILVKMDRYIDLEIFLKENFLGQVSYSVWLDYWNRETSILGKDILDYSYNFVNDGPGGTLAHNSELIKQGTDTIAAGEPINTRKISNIGLGSDYSWIGKKQLRIAVKQGSTPPTQNEVSDITPGEVEDYLVHAVLPNPDSEEIQNMLNELVKRMAKIWIRRQHQDSDTDANSPPCNDDSTNSNNPQDETPGSGDNASDVPHTYNVMIGPCAITGDCYVADTSVEGEEYINANNGNHVALDVGNEFIHDAVQTRTVISRIQPAINSANEIIYEEGGEHDGNGNPNGFGIFINNQGYAEFQVEINGVEETIMSLEELAHDREVVLKATFGKGVMTLEIDQEIQGKNTSFAASNMIEIPFHNGDANWGGGVQSVEDDDTLGNFTGKLIELLVYDDLELNAILSEIVTGISSPLLFSTISTGLSTKGGNKKDDIKSPKEQDRLPDFSIFPNPATDKLNILVEVSLEGPLQIDMYDMNGRQVYTLNRPKITQGHQLITLPVEDLSAGNYIVRIRAGNVWRSEKVVVE